MKRPLLLIAAILFLDQAIKWWVKLTMYLGEELHIADWFILHFTENNGMAFGMEFGGDYGKLFLSVFRILFVSGLIYYLRTQVRAKADPLYITCVAMVIAGASGNIIDSIFYGKIFNSSVFQIAQFLPAEGGYSGWLHGKVVDMFYFPLLQGYFPSWVPFWGGQEFQFFRPVFNLADASISVGIALMFIFQKRFFTPQPKEVAL